MKFKNTLVLALSILALGCTYDPVEEVELVDSLVPRELTIVEPVGLKLENIFVTDKVSINAKLPQDGTYRLKIKDIGGKLISQEKLEAKKGDNLLSIYTSSLPKTSYTVELHTDNGTLLGSSIFVIQE